MKTVMRRKTPFARCLSTKNALVAAAICGVSAASPDARATGHASGTWAVPPADPPPLPAPAVTAKGEVRIEPAAPAVPSAVNPEPAPAVENDEPVHGEVRDRPRRAERGDRFRDRDRDRVEAPVQERFLHGFRVGYAYVANYDKPIVAFETQTTNSDGSVTSTGVSLKEKVHMRTPHQFLIGYEGMYRMTGHSWLNVILVGNVLVGGLEQSQFYPTANTILGFEFNSSFQLGVGANIAPLKDNIAHVVVAGGWTPRVGSFYVPVHAFFIPDVDGVHRMGMTTGVTW